MKIEHTDIATVEALHDLLIDIHGYNPEFITLKKARKLISKLYDMHAKEAGLKTAKEFIEDNKIPSFKEILKEEIQKEYIDNLTVKDLQNAIIYTRKELKRAKIECDNENDYFIITQPLKQQLKQYEEDTRATKGSLLIKKAIF